MADTQTKQLIVKAAGTYIPTKEDQIINSGVYLTGDQTIKGDANLLPQNIVSGKTIFGIAGTADASTSILYSNKIIVDTGSDGCNVFCTDKNNNIINATYKDNKYYLEGLTWGTYIVKAEKDEFKTSNTIIFEDNLIYTTEEIFINIGLPDFVYTGDYNLVYDDENINTSLDWSLKLLSSGKLKFNSLNALKSIDIFMVGGGGSGACYHYNATSLNGGGDGGAGGGGGYTKTIKRFDSSKIEVGKIYDVTIGAGGLAVVQDGNLGNPGGNTSIFDISVEGGKCPSSPSVGGAGGSGGGGLGKNGGSDGSDGTTNEEVTGGTGGIGQKLSTRAFGEITGTLYAGGGGGGGYSTGYRGGAGGEGGGGNGAAYIYDGSAYNHGGNGTSNTGGGGGGGATKMDYLGESQGYRRDPKNPGNGGSGIIIIRNTKTLSMLDFDYSGYYELVDDNDEIITTPTKNWKLRLLTSGTLKILNMEADSIDVFLVGGGGGGSTSNTGSAGGGGYTRTEKNISLELNKEYEIVIGDGGDDGTTSSDMHDGKESSAFGFKAAGGKGGKEYYRGGNGGSGGATSGGKYGEDGFNSTGGEDYPGQGQRYVEGPNGETGSTREFGESTGKLYASGGGIYYKDDNTDNYRPISTVGYNCGFGGLMNDEYDFLGGRNGKGYPGIVIIRNHRI